MPHSVDIPDHTQFGSNAVDKLADGNEHPSKHDIDRETSLVLKTVRLLVADLCQQFNGGHPG